MGTLTTGLEKGDTLMFLLLYHAFKAFLYSPQMGGGLGPWIFVVLYTIALIVPLNAYENRLVPKIGNVAAARQCAWIGAFFFGLLLIGGWFFVNVK
jgi:hypothetical protein